MKLPFISRKKHEAEIKELKKQISNICNTGCRTAKCQGEPKSLGTNGSKTGHTVVHSGKRVRVMLHDGTTFNDKFKDKTGKFHYFYAHGRVSSSQIRKLTIIKGGNE